MTRASVVITVKNEENTILPLLSSLAYQALKPYEIIIVDGGSEDRTLGIIRSFIDSNHESLMRVRVILANNANRAQGRNIGIAATSSDIVACTDAGVVLDKCWLQNLVRPIASGRVDFAGGVYVQGDGSLLQKCIGILQYPNLEKLSEDDFLPSSRSVAFKKTVWESVGGYPEYLEKAEDTLFDLTVHQKFKVGLARDAVVCWPARNTFRELFLQYSSYADWDMKSGLFLRVKIYRLMILAYVFLAFSIFLILTFGFIGFLPSFSITMTYLTYAGVKAFRKTHITKAFFLAMAIKITIFSAETLGIMKGAFNRVRQAKRKTSDKLKSEPIAKQ